MNYFENEYCNIQLNTNESVAYVNWKAETENMEIDSYKEQQMAQLNSIKEYQISRFLIDGRQQKFVITPDIQDWTMQNSLSPAISLGLTKVAILLPTEIFAQVSIEQTMGENSGKFQTKYFESEPEAKKWIVS